ncbi:TPA: hypothetical protein ACNH8T_003735 [Proteus mirabilis]
MSTQYLCLRQDIRLFLQQITSGLKSQEHQKFDGLNLESNSDIKTARDKSDQVRSELNKDELVGMGWI